MFSLKTKVGRNSKGPGSSSAHHQAQEPLLRSSSELWCVPEVGIETKNKYTYSSCFQNGLLMPVYKMQP